MAKRLHKTPVWRSRCSDAASAIAKIRRRSEPKADADQEATVEAV
jgi:hypothetical protein